MNERWQKFIYLCKERYEIKLRKDQGLPRPWTKDPILHKFHFCNVFRRDDKTSIEIQKLIKEQSTQKDRLRAAIVGRMVNKVGSIFPIWKVKDESVDNIAVTLHTVGVNTNAYKLNTPLGLNNIQGVAMLISTDVDSLALSLSKATSLLSAHSRLSSYNREKPKVAGAPQYGTYFVSSFIGYQVVLDLLDANFWEVIDSDSWALAGPGACRGMQYLRGDQIDYFWDSAKYKHTSIDLAQKVQIYLPKIAMVLQHNWPIYWPPLTIHEAQFMLCELDKYVRKEAGFIQGRLYKNANGKNKSSLL